jgi:hypothetical protein
MTTWEIEDRLSRIAHELERGRCSRTVAASDLRRLIADMRGEERGRATAMDSAGVIRWIEDEEGGRS